MIAFSLRTESDIFSATVTFKEALDSRPHTARRMGSSVWEGAYLSQRFRLYG